MNQLQFINQVNQYAIAKQPFFFIIDFEMNHPFVCKLEDAALYGFYFNLNSVNNETKLKANIHKSDPYNAVNIETHPLNISPIALKDYQYAFDKVMTHLNLGDTYLLNLSFATPINQSIDLESIFVHAHARYKLLYTKRSSRLNLANDFVLFSPECFIKINNNKIYAYPMKGTIDAHIENAAQIILADKKELWEHNTIVDLIRNDLAMIADNIEVTKFRYIDQLKTDHKTLLQVSSEITGQLPNHWQQQLGTILFKLLPAGSISGAPKKKTVEIIQAAEKGKRGFYTGIFGIFDGENLDSAVNIRFITETTTGFAYHSGGGITAMSQLQSEYNELLDKIYVPTF